MRDAVVNTSQLIYLHRVGTLDLMPRLFREVSVPSAVVDELQEGLQRGYDVPNTANYPWLQVVDAKAIPSEWLALDLGPGR